MSKWQTVDCAECGREFHICEDWSNPTRYCNDCRHYNQYCKNCGRSFQVSRDWNNIPNYCKDCKESFQQQPSQYYDQSCKKCGKSFRVSREWEHIPNYCKECRQAFTKEQEEKYYSKPCQGCGTSMRVSRNWEHVPNYCSNCKAKYASQSQRGQKVWVNKNHYRIVSQDGRKSYLYWTDGWTSYCVEITEHYEDGTTRAFEVERSVIKQLLSGPKGNPKS